MSHKFESVSSLRSALYHEVGDSIPEEGDFSVGYFHGRQQAKKWLVTARDLEAMYTYYLGKQSISLWCDGKVDDEGDEEGMAKKKKRTV